MDRGKIAKRSSRQGKSFERRVIAFLSSLFEIESFNNRNHLTAQIGSSRQFDRNLDARKVDIWIKPDILNRLMIQCKKTLNKSQSTLNIDVSSLREMSVPKDSIKLLFTKVTCRPNKIEREVGTYVTMELKDFEQFLKSWYEKNREILQVGKDQSDTSKEVS